MANFWSGLALAAAAVASPIRKPTVTMMLAFFVTNCWMLGA